MAEPRKEDLTRTTDEDLASTSNDDRITANDENQYGPAPQGGKGTPSQAEGDRQDDPDHRADH